VKKSYAILGNSALLTCKTKMGQSYPDYALANKLKTLKVSKPLAFVDFTVKCYCS